MLIGTCSQVFAVDFSQAFTQAEEQSAWIDSIFKGKLAVSNLYSKALKLAKDREIVASSASFDLLKQHYSQCSRVETKDFINVLYNSNFSFRETFNQILPEWTKKPSSKEIDKSYQKFLTCQGVTSTNDTITAIRSEINNLYYDGYSNSYSLSSINEDNFWSDFFWNGTLSDGPFDLLIDINNIGKLLFDNFKESPKILFYSLPKVSSQGGNPSYDSVWWETYQVWGGWWLFSGTVWWSSDTNSSLSNITTSQNDANTNKQLPEVMDDIEIQNFIQGTNPTLSSDTTASVLVLGDQCLSWETEQAATWGQPIFEDPKQYLDDIATFIDTASLNDVLDTALLDKFHKNNSLPTWWSTSDSWYADSIANTYAEQAFGEAAPGTCEYSCKDLPLDQQAQCEFSCAGICIKKCNNASKDSQSACQTNYDNKKSSCDANSSSDCSAKYTQAMNVCNAISSSTCDAKYTQAMNSCELQNSILKPICKSQAFVEKTECLASVQIQKTTCPITASTNRVSCLANITLSPIKRLACKATAKKQQISCANDVYTTEALCVSDCACFMIAWPNGKWWEKVEDMFRIKFCKVPVQKKTISPGKTVYSIQAIFQEISDVLEWLRDSGQMVKFSKTKEYLDGNVKINFADNFAFKLQVWFKPVFPQKSTTTKIQEETQANMDLNQSILGMNTTDPTSDDYNKYIVVSNPIVNKANLEQATSLADINANIAKFNSDATAYTTVSVDTMKSLSTTFSQGTKILFIQSMITFLQDNQSFWNDLSQALLDINEMAFELKTKIENSK